MAGDTGGLGRYIARRRKYMRITQGELADRIGISKSAIAKWETDGGLPDRDNLRRLSEVIGVSVDDLYKVIDRSGGKNDIEANITSDVIASLESHGYRIIRQTDMDK